MDSTPLLKLQAQLDLKAPYLITRGAIQVTFDISNVRYMTWDSYPTLANVVGVRSASRDHPAAKRALKRLPRRVFDLRTKAQLTQEQAAESAGVEPKYWISLEAGRANPTLATLAAVAAALGCSLSELLTDV